MNAELRLTSINRVFVVLAVIFPFLSLLTVVRPMLEADAPTTTVFVVAVLVLVEMALLLSCRSEVVVDADRVRVLASPARVPVFTCRLDTIEKIETAEIRALAWGGWGIRWKPGEIALLNRSGPGFVITTTAGRRCAVTCDSPDEVVDWVRAATAPGA